MKTYWAATIELQNAALRRPGQESIGFAVRTNSQVVPENDGRAGHDLKAASSPFVVTQVQTAMYAKVSPWLANVAMAASTA